ncbi:hypothetical protein DAPPUDRAFT_305846 [Daphnia pulex]|uniref:Ribosome-recycling factor, mitochondrial n=2 Tax=Daphnia pulex TaxID=6669 RepID=E9GTF0_DAPPU|nr:hypothetical protein DAPPUDRAFT_305846 [Daphnia pulex]|eukprot:EFX77370.1 hypothetical protein DAPPUDRAFT_305846 [Daphnia pulex]
MTYCLSYRFLCNYLQRQITGSRYAVGLLRNTEKVFCGHGGYRSMSSLHQPKIFHLPAIGSPSFPSWCIIKHWNISLKSKRFYSKTKGGEKKKKGSVFINEDEIAELVKVSSLKQDLQKGLDQLKSDYVKHLSLRSASGSIENLKIDYEGETYTLQEIAQIGKKGSQLLVVNLSGFPTLMRDVLKAINDSGMGLNPQQDGTKIFIPIPKVTREYRENLAKNAKTMFQKFKDHSRDIQNRYIRDVKKKEKEVSSDLSHSVQQQIQTMTEQYVVEGEKVMIAKQNELLGKE